ncbi:MAG: response regulator [Dehalococcoidales bacterium]|nr:response regulator [Dehalococcoidales bacterium]
MSKILVVDDAAFVRMQYKKSLSAKGYDVEEASNGVEAIKKYREIDPDGVLLDINMPEMDGIVTLHEILNMDPNAKVAMVSCVGSQSIVLTALRTGARDFVTKPTDKDGIVNTVQKLLAC